MKAKREWTSPDGVRCVEMEGIDGPMVDGRDLGKWLLTIDSKEIADPAKRAAFEQYQREAAVLNPAAQYRRAVEMLTSFGAVFPPDCQSLKPAAVKP